MFSILTEVAAHCAPLVFQQLDVPRLESVTVLGLDAEATVKNCQFCNASLFDAYQLYACSESEL
eukprot:6212720-Amphidinium_carterae.1